MSDNTIKRPRPLSPHLQVYRLPVTALTSILHRATGAALTAGMLMIIWWLWAAATTTDNYDMAMSFARSPLGIICLFGWSFSLYYHMLNGLRHLVWDAGHLFDKELATKTSYAVFFGALAITILTWVFAYV